MTAIYDAILRQQVFLEGVKAAQHEPARKTTTQIIMLFIDEVRSLSDDAFVNMSKRQLSALLRAIRDKAVSLYSKYSLAFLDFLQEFTRTETSMSALILKEVSDDLTRNVPLKDFGKQKSGKVWADIKGSTLAATGEDFGKFIDALGATVILKAEQAVRMAHVNNDTVSALLDALGPKKGGLLNKLLADSRAMVSTAIQHVSAFVNNTVQSAFYDEYEWVSTIDNSTSEICRSRNGNIYKYGEGPLPPAHRHCRSRTVPITQTAKKTRDSFAKWLTEQDATVQKFALSEFPPPLTLTEYKSKTGQIVI